MATERIKTSYVGVYFREAKRIGGKGIEKVFYVTYKKNGKTHEEKCGRQYADDMTPAKASGIRADLIEGKRLPRKEIRSQEENKKKAEAGKWTVNRLWEEYKKTKPNLKGIVTDQNRYENHIKPSFGKKQPAEILPLDVKRLENKLLKKRASATVANVLELLRRIINFGANSQLCASTSFKIRLPEVNNETTEHLTPKQLKRLLKAIEEDTHLQAGDLMKLALYTGLRRGELFKLKWQDIDFDRGFITLKDPKGGPDQRVPLNGVARQVLMNHLRIGRSPYVFPGQGGKRRTDIKKAVNKIKKAAKLPKDFRAIHGLRHAYASMLASSGKVDLYTLQKLLTHKSPQMVQRYAYLHDSALKRAANLIDDLVKHEGEKIVKLNDS